MNRINSDIDTNRDTNTDSGVGRYGKKILIPFVVLIIAGVILLAILPLVRNNNGVEESVSDDTDVQVDLDLLPLTSTKEVQIGARTYVMPENWNVSAKLSSPTGTDYICESCTLVIVTNDASNASLMEVVLSSPVAATREWGVDTDDVTQQVSSLGMQFNMSGPKYYISEDTDGSDLVETDAYVQLSGCIPNDICLYAGRLSPTIETNRVQVEELKSFLSSLRVK